MSKPDDYDLLDLIEQALDINGTVGHYQPMKVLLERIQREETARRAAVKSHLHEFGCAMSDMEATVLEQQRRIQKLEALLEENSTRE